MSTSSKYTLYDWYGTNQELFKSINHMFRSDAYDHGMLFLSYFFDADNFPYFFGAFALYAALTWVFRWMGAQDDKQRRHYLTRWLGVLAVLAFGFVAMGLTVKTLKADFGYPRPYVALASDEVRLLEKHIDVKDDKHSFPSGHAAFITFLVVALWPVLSRDMRVAGLFLVPLVCWSRIALGVHFPADVVYGVAISLIIVLFVRRFVYWLLDTLFGLEC